MTETTLRSNPVDGESHGEARILGERQQSKRAERRRAFAERLRELSEAIHACPMIDEIKCGPARDIVVLFGCNRLVLHTVGVSRITIESKIRTGVSASRSFTALIGNASIASHVALTRRPLNIRNVYDGNELHSHSRELRFPDAVDRRTSYRTREMIAALVISGGTAELPGVVPLINNRLGRPFSELVDEGMLALCKTLAVAFEQRNKPVSVGHTRFDPLVMLGMLSRPELEPAKLTAWRKRLELEDVLIDEFQVRPEQLGAAYARFFDVPYEPWGKAASRRR